MTEAERFRHMAVTLLPWALAALRDLKPSDFKGEDVKGSDVVTTISIVAEVAETLSRAKYGKPRIRVPARRAA